MKRYGRQRGRDKGRNSEFRRVTGLFEADPPRGASLQFRGRVSGEYVGKLLEIVEEAERAGDDLMFFVTAWKNGDTDAVLSVTRSERRQRRRRRRDDEDDERPRRRRVKEDEEDEADDDLADDEDDDEEDDEGDDDESHDEEDETDQQELDL